MSLPFSQGVLAAGEPFEGGSQPPGGETAAPEAARRADLAEVLARIGVACPDRESIVERSQSLANALLEAADAVGTGETDAALAAKARSLAAEALLLGGEEREARRVLEGIVRGSPLAEERARALYLLGALYFFRERYVASAPEGGGPAPASAKAYWDILVARFPESEWARRAARPLRYLRLLSGEAPPDVRGTFELDGKSFDQSLSGLRGKVACLVVSRTATRELRDLASALGPDLRAAFGRTGELDGMVSVLEIRLGPKEEAAGGRRTETAPPWPILYDPRGFESPFVRELGIPYAPHFIVLDPEGKPAYVGGDGAKFRSALARELERWKGAAPESAR